MPAGQSTYCIQIHALASSRLKTQNEPILGSNFHVDTVLSVNTLHFNQMFTHRQSKGTTFILVWQVWRPRRQKQGHYL